MQKTHVNHKRNVLLGPLEPTGPTWAHLGPLGPTWAHLGPLGPAWAHLGPLGPTWAHLGPPGPTRARLGPLGPMFPKNIVNKFVFARIAPGLKDLLVSEAIILLLIFVCMKDFVQHTLEVTSGTCYTWQHLLYRAAANNTDRTSASSYNSLPSLPVELGTIGRIRIREFCEFGSIQFLMIS